jgi:POT family proton-dependent oligopeptide transporter
VTYSTRVSYPEETRTLFGHPKTLFTVASLELWERFSFYGLDVILAYYLYFSLTDGGLGLPKGVALGITGAYGGTIYAAQIIGAWLADRIVPPRTLALAGAVLIMCGHLTLAIFQDLPGFIVGLVFIVFGTAGLKVNTTRMVGDLYSSSSNDRDTGYTLYYMGISIGAFLGPIVTGALFESINFHVAFAAAAVGMAIGLLIYLLGWKRLPEPTAVVANPLPRDKYKVVMGAAVAGIVVVGALIATDLLTLDNVSRYVLSLVVVASLGYFVVILSSRKATTARERGNVVAYIPVFLGTLVFWALLLQLFTTFAVYIDERVNLAFGSFTIPAPWLITAEGVINALLGPVIAVVWTRLGTKQPSPVTKIVIGLLALVVANLIFGLAAGQQDHEINVLVVILGFALFALAEIIVAPTAMSATRAYAPKAFGSQLMALYFLTMSGGATLSGLLAIMYSPEHERVFFFVTAAVTAVIAAGLLALARMLPTANVEAVRRRGRDAETSLD